MVLRGASVSFQFGLAVTNLNPPAGPDPSKLFLDCELLSLDHFASGSARVDVLSTIQNLQQSEPPGPTNPSAAIGRVGCFAGPRRRALHNLKLESPGPPGPPGPTNPARSHADTATREPPSPVTRQPRDQPPPVAASRGLALGLRKRPVTRGLSCVTGHAGTEPT